MLGNYVMCVFWEGQQPWADPDITRNDIVDLEHDLTGRQLEDLKAPLFKLGNPARIDRNLICALVHRRKIYGVRSRLKAFEHFRGAAQPRSDMPDAPVEDSERCRQTMVLHANLHLRFHMIAADDEIPESCGDDQR